MLILFEIDCRRKRVRLASSMDAPKVRSARIEDRMHLSALLEDSGLSAFGLTDALSDVLVAEQGGKLVGMAGFERYGDRVLVRSVAVRTTHRSGGIGRALISELLDRARDQGASRAYLLTETAERFFSRLGFEQVPRSSIPAAVLTSPHVVAACPESCTCMALTP